jgi:putative transposase
MAVDQREAVRGSTVIHSDHGTPFTSWTFTERARKSGLLPSMGSIGDCFDNALIEAFWSRMQVELLDTRRWKTRIELANANLRVHRDLPQPPPTPLRARDADTDRI